MIMIVKNPGSQMGSPAAADKGGEEMGGEKGESGERREASERSAHLVKIAKTSQLKEDMYQKLKEGAVTLAKLQHLSPQKTNNCTKKYGNSVRRITPIF